MPDCRIIVLRVRIGYPTSNKQLCFLQHNYRGLRKATDSKPGGRAAVVIPDLQGHAAPEVLVDLMDKLHNTSSLSTPMIATSSGTLIL